MLQMWEEIALMLFMGFPLCLVEWVKTYYRNRLIKVEIEWNDLT